VKGCVGLEWSPSAQEEKSMHQFQFIDIWMISHFFLFVYRSVKFQPNWECRQPVVVTRATMKSVWNVLFKYIHTYVCSKTHDRACMYSHLDDSGVGKSKKYFKIILKSWNVSLKIPLSNLLNCWHVFIMHVLHSQFHGTIAKANGKKELDSKVSLMLH
jgi:hypothetical protein